MATPTTTLPKVTLATLGGESAHVTAGMRRFRNTLWSGIGSAAPMMPKVLYLAAATGVTAMLALPLMKRTPVLVEA